MKIFRLIEDNLQQVQPIVQTVYKTLLNDKQNIVTVILLHYANTKLEATSKLSTLILRNTLAFRNHHNVIQRIGIALNIITDSTKLVLPGA